MQSHFQHGADQPLDDWLNDIGSYPQSLRFTPELQAAYDRPKSTGSQEHGVNPYAKPAPEAAYTYVNYNGAGCPQGTGQVTQPTKPPNNQIVSQRADQVDRMKAYYTCEGALQSPAQVNLEATTFLQESAHQPADANDLMTIKSFPDFLDGSIHTSYIQGNAPTLDSLSAMVHDGARVHHPGKEDMYYAYRPLETAISGVCNRYGIPSYSAEQLCRIHRGFGFQARAETYATEHRLSQDMFAAMMNLGIINEDVMAVLLGMFTESQPFHFVCHLGFVVFNRNEYPHAFLYPVSVKGAAAVAWVVCDNREGLQHFAGISPGPRVPDPLVANKALGTPAMQGNPRSAPRRPTKRRLPAGFEETPTKASKTTRDTSAAVRAAQIPHPSTYTAHDIYTDHASNLHYNNMLKVGLVYSNADIIKRLQALPDAGQRLNSQSAVAKRIGTGCDWLADRFSVPRPVLRHAYDTARRQSRINARPKKHCSEAELARWSQTCRAALQWVEQGGPLAPDVAARFGVVLEAQAEEGKEEEEEEEEDGEEDAPPVFAAPASPRHDTPMRLDAGFGFDVAPVPFAGFDVPRPSDPLFASSALGPAVTGQEHWDLDVVDLALLAFDAQPFWQ